MDGSLPIMAGILLNQAEKNYILIEDIQHSDMDLNTKLLLAHSWKLNCLSKLRYFVWQIISGSLPVTKNLRSRGIKCDLQCHICGAEEEYVNHVLFKCPLALQIVFYLTFLLFQRFSLSISFSNIDYLFWRIPKKNRLKLFFMDFMVYLKKL